MAPKQTQAEAAPPAEDDVSMGDVSAEAPAANGIDLNDPAKAAEMAQRIKILPGSTDTAASFEFTGEDHTLGNSLRYIIMKNPNVEFCGYSIPHPSEDLMNIRIQTYPGTTVTEALEKGFNDLMDLCDVVENKFEEARSEFQSGMQT
ncbi:DNA-directed RNA polymerase [Halenospora varia]|nr:DNA-directed RNA polymerase [Halenospora varia]